MLIEEGNMISLGPADASRPRSFADHHAAYDDPAFTFVGMTNFAACGRKAAGAVDFEESRHVDRF